MNNIHFLNEKIYYCNIFDFYKIFIKNNYVNRKEYFIYKSNYNLVVWPSYGKIFIDLYKLRNYYINIYGYKNQYIYAFYSGKVIYVGNIFHEYRNLIIIKHNNNYLSVYACNYKSLVKENQIVHTGQKIAIMGNRNNRYKLYFEIRYKGKSINPLYYLSIK